MSDKNDFLLKYFFICGVSEEIKNELKINKFQEENNIKPILLSSYSAEGKTKLFEILKNKINEDNYLQDNIFPKKADFLSNIIFSSNDSELPTLELKVNPFNQYIYNTNKFEERPEHFYHCFQYLFKIEETSEDNVILNFTVLIFYENVTDERDLLKEKNERNWLSYTFFPSNFYNCFIGKAVILVSGKPLFSFMKDILEYIYKQYINKKYSYFPIEPIIMNCFEKINKDNTEEKSENERKYKLYKEPILPYCDLNISFFIKLFDLDDIFLIAEFYLCSKNIIIACSNIEFLFPIYYIFMTLFFPLNKNSNERFYKLLVPNEDNLQRTIFGMLPTFQFIYNRGKLDNEILNQISIIKDEEILIYEINENDNDNDKENLFYIIKKIIKYDKNEGKAKRINLIKYNTIIEKVCILNEEIYIDLISLLKSDIKEIKKYFDKNKKKPTFFDFSFDYSKYDSIRNHFIGLFIKFFVTCLNPIKFKLIDNKIDIDIIEFESFKDDDNANELLNTLYTTPQSDLIYKNVIIKKGEFDNKILKNIILLDYFLKISSKDDKRFYFEPKMTKDINKIKDKENKLNLKDLFNYENILNKNKNIYYYFNRLYLYPLQNSKEKTYYMIEEARYFIEHLEFYEELTKESKSNDIEIIKKKKALKYMIFYGERFELHFGQFVNKNGNYLYKKHKIDMLNYSFIDNFANNKIYEKYYKAILDEADIFYDLFVTQIIVIENRKQLACCAIGLFISIYIINLMSELSSKNPNNDKLLEMINNNKEKIFKLFNITKGFYGKFDFLITLLFQIISSRQYKKNNYKDYTNILIEKLKEEQILPSITVILMYNHEKSLDFRYIKKYMEKDDKKNKINNHLDLSKTIMVPQKNEDKSQYKKYNSNIDHNEFKINKELNKEIIIYNIERKKHEHNYNIMDEINGDYNCENYKISGCSDILCFSIEKNKDNVEDYYLINPRYIIIRILKNILDNNSLFIYPYTEYNDDIYQIAMIDELYFQIGFFKNN